MLHLKALETALGVAAAAALAALIESLPGIGVVLEAAALGGLVGTTIGLWRKRRDPDTDVAELAARWGVATGGVALLVQLLSLVI